MKIDHPYACNVCQVQKKETNHWWKAFLLRGVEDELKTTGIVVVPWEVNEVRGPAPTFEPIKSLLVDNADAHLCGRECATKYISKTLFQEANR